MSGKRKTALATACAFTWFGHACGASMATGRLAVQYCSLHGPIGLVGAVVVWIASVAFAWIIMEYARLIKAENYHDVVKTIYWPNRILGSVMNVVWDLITLFSVVVVSGTCIAGSGALLESAFGLNYYIGMVLFTALMLLIFLSGGGVLKKLGGISVPMLVLLIIMCVVIITMGWDNLKAVMAGELNSYIEPGKETLGSTVLDGITYGMTQSGFVATGIVYSRQFESRKETNKACLLGFLFGTASLVPRRQQRDPALPHGPAAALRRARLHLPRGVLCGTVYRLYLHCGLPAAGGHLPVQAAAGEGGQK